MPPTPRYTNGNHEIEPLPKGADMWGFVKRAINYNYRCVQPPAFRHPTALPASIASGPLPPWTRARGRCLPPGPLTAAAALQPALGKSATCTSLPDPGSFFCLHRPWLPPAVSRCPRRPIARRAGRRCLRPSRKPARPQTCTTRPRCVGMWKGAGREARDDRIAWIGPSALGLAAG